MIHVCVHVYLGTTHMTIYIYMYYVVDSEDGTCLVYMYAYIIYNIILLYAWYIYTVYV